MAPQDRDIFDLSVASILGSQHEDVPEKAAGTDRFSEERVMWTDRLTSMAKKIEKLERLAEVEVSAFSFRAVAIENKHTYINAMSQASRQYKVLEADRIKYYAAQKKYTVDQLKTIIGVELADNGAVVDTLKYHIEFLEETVKTIDNIIYGVKYRIDLQRFLDVV